MQALNRSMGEVCGRRDWMQALCFSNRLGCFNDGQAVICAFPLCGCEHGPAEIAQVSSAACESFPHTAPSTANNEEGLPSRLPVVDCVSCIREIDIFCVHESLAGILIEASPFVIWHTATPQVQISTIGGGSHASGLEP